ncbi:MAG: signal peptidase I [Jatrophihabitans sp.]
MATSEPQEGDDEPGDVGRKPSALSSFWKRWRRGLVKLVVLAAVAAVAATLLRIFVLAPYYIPSESMEPTLHGCTGCDNDHVLVDKISYRFHDPRQSDIVVFDKPKGVVVPAGEDVLIKRVIALPGDTIAIKKGRVIVNGALLKESYLNKDKSCYPSTNMVTRTVPANRVFVMGDNRCNSTDSRVFGTIPESAIVGRAWLIIWPLKRIGTL